MKSVIVVGAGILGVSHAMHLSEVENLSVTLIDRASGPAMNFGTGSSSACIRRCYSSRELTLMANYGVEFLNTLREDSKDPSIFVQSGCLTLGSPQSSFVASQKDIFDELNFGYEELEENDLQSRYPWMNCCDSEVGILDTQSGYSSPHEVTTALYRIALLNGTKSLFNIGVAALVTRGSKITGVKLDDGQIINADYVVLATSYSTFKLLSEIGYPPESYKSTIHPVLTARFDIPATSSPIPVLADTTNEIYCRPEGSGLLVGSLAPIDELNIAQEFDPDFVVDSDRLDSLIERVAVRFHEINLNKSKIKIVRGFYDVNDKEWMPIQSKLDIQGLHVSYATSGHGFKLAFALSRLLLFQMQIRDLPNALRCIPGELFSTRFEGLKSEGVLS